MSGGGSRSPSPPTRAPFASLRLGPRRVAIDGVVTIGRDPASGLCVDDPEVSREHARVHRERSGYAIEDLGSQNGTFLNGERIVGRHGLQPGDTIAVAGVVIEVAGEWREPGLNATTILQDPLPLLATARVKLTGPCLTIGRDPESGLVLEHPTVSRTHAVIERDSTGLTLIDRGSANGTRLNGIPVTRTTIRSGDEIGIGPYAVVLQDDALVPRDEHGQLRLEAVGVAVSVAGRQLLTPTSLTVEPGELLVVIGESGAGKSTLIKAMAGVTQPSDGRITVNGAPLTACLSEVGYVPQDEIVHGLLTVREALTFAARLRLPDDASTADVDAAVNRVLEELRLTEHDATRVDELSGGQRKRVGVGVELVSRPSLLFLDEPTSGLDPGLETRTMELLRSLADVGRGVAVVTHATTNLGLCDRLVVMGRGGILTFSGAPEAALDFFGVANYQGIYEALDATPAREWNQRYREICPDHSEHPPGDGGQPVRRRRSALRQTSLLTQRYVRLMGRDRKNLAILLGQVPLLALFEVGLFKGGLFDVPGGRPGDGVSLLFLLVINTVWLGALDGTRELVRERTVFRRESAIGVRLSAYLLSKLMVLFPLSLLQTIALTLVVTAFRPLHVSTETFLQVLAVLGLTGLVAVSMGLLISAAAGTEDQAISITPLAVLPQILYAGALVPIARMAGVMAAFSYVIFGRWSLAAMGTAINMNRRFAQSPEFASVNRFGTHFFTLSTLTGIGVLAAFLVAFLGATAALLHRQTAPIRRRG